MNVITTRLLIILCINLSLIHISEPTRLGMISYAVFCLKKKNVTHEPINPATLYYDGSTKARWVQKAKLQNT